MFPLSPERTSSIEPDSLDAQRIRSRGDDDSILLDPSRSTVHTGTTIDMPFMNLFESYSDTSAATVLLKTNL